MHDPENAPHVDGLEIILRRVPPSTGLMAFIRQLAAGLKRRLPGSDRMEVSVEPYYPHATDDKAFEVMVRVESPTGTMEARHIDRDLYFAVRDAFEQPAYRLYQVA